MAEERTYQVKVTGPGVSIEQEVAKAIGDQIVLLVLTGGSQVATPSGGVVAPPPATVEPPTLPATTNRTNNTKSLREFLTETAPVRSIDKIVAIGVYKADYENTDAFTNATLTSAFRSANEKVPANLGRDLGSAVRAGWIAKDPDNSRSYYVTETGRKVVEAKFPKEDVKKAKINRPKPKAKKKKVSGSE